MSSIYSRGKGTAPQTPACMARTSLVAVVAVALAVAVVVKTVTSVLKNSYALPSSVLSRRQNEATDSWSLAE